MGKNGNAVVSVAVTFNKVEEINKRLHKNPLQPSTCMPLSFCFRPVALRGQARVRLSPFPF